MKKDSTNTGEFFTCIRTVSYLLRSLFSLHEPDLLVCSGYRNSSGSQSRHNVFLIRDQTPGYHRDMAFSADFFYHLRHKTRKNFDHIRMDIFNLFLDALKSYRIYYKKTHDSKHPLFLRLSYDSRFRRYYTVSMRNGMKKTQILKDDLFHQWYQVFPERFQNKTNGVTPRRWLGLCNPELTQMIKYRVGGDFLKDLDRLSKLKPMIDDDMVRQFNEIKRKKKEQLCQVVAKHEGVELNPDFIFDVQVKRLHEYKRQLLNALSIVDIYFRLKDGSLPDFQPTVYLFGAKSAPGYARAKAIIRYINRIAKMINSDPQVHDKLKVVFVQNYNCSYAEHIIPAADISEQISPAGTEASGTGNMKLMLNGAVTLGTLDGANVEIVKEAGQENNYIFGATVEQINASRDSYYARGIYDTNPRLHRAIDTLVDGTVPTDDDQRELYHALLDGTSWHKADHYFLLLDYESYMDAKLRANRDYADRLAFGRKCLMNVASASKFSSDRTIRQYANEIWHIKPTQY